MKKWIADIICGLMILLFTYAAISKLIDRTHFQAVLSQMLLIKSFAGFISFALPVIELLVCTLLFMPATRLWGLYASCGLMILFTLYIGFMILFARCFRTNELETAFSIQCHFHYAFCNCYQTI